MFNVYDRVVIKSKDDIIIGGMHFYDTENSLIELFGEAFEYDRCYSREIEGEIAQIGKYNTYIIKCGLKRYVFCNDYNEMELKKCGGIVIA